MALQCLFVVQGEGRGHLTQAMALRRMLVEAGHRVEGVVVGTSPARTVPSFFEAAFEGPVSYVNSPSFVPDSDDRSVRPFKSLLHALRRMPTFWRGVKAIDAAIESHDPDVVVNFFEVLMGAYAMVRRPSVPIVAVAHQYMFLHPAYRFPLGRRMERWGVQTVARSTACGANRRLALSLYPAPDRPQANLSVVPPLLRSDLFARSPGPRDAFILVYLLNSGYAEEIIRWHEAHPDVPLHCFWDRSDAAAEEPYDDTLTFHRLDDEKFLDFMARCRAFVSTAGFESVAEAMYLQTPVQVVPVEGHFEQACNAFDAVRAGAGIRSPRFDIDRLLDYLPAYAGPVSGFRSWVQSAGDRVVREIEATADRPNTSNASMAVEPGPAAVEKI